MSNRNRNMKNTKYILVFYVKLIDGTWKQNWQLISDSKR